MYKYISTLVKKDTYVVTLKFLVFLGSVLWHSGFANCLQCHHHVLKHWLQWQLSASDSAPAGACGKAANGGQEGVPDGVPSSGFLTPGGRS